MRYKLLVLVWILGSSTDLAPDIQNPFYYCKPDIDVVTDLMYHFDLSIDFIIMDFVMPILNIMAWISFNVSAYMDQHSFIWLLFFEHVTLHDHTGFSVRSFKCFRPVFFGRRAGLIMAVILLAGGTTGVTSCSLGTSHLGHKRGNAVYVTI